MSKALVIVESPAKAKTINKYLGKDYEVEASLGHVKDLPKSKIGVDIENNFEAEYIVIPGKEKVLTNLKKKAKTAFMNSSRITCAARTFRRFLQASAR